jgi:hypothetical protein
MKRLIEIRSYALKPGTAKVFHSLVTSTAIPMLRRSGMEVVAFGPSGHDPDAYFLIRAYSDLAELESQQNAFYSSEPWLTGPRDAIVSRINSYLNTVLWLSEESITDLRRSNTAGEG